MTNNKKKINKEARLEIRLQSEKKNAIKEIAKELNTSMTELTTVLMEKMIGNRELLLSIYSENKRENDLIEYFVEDTFNSYLDSVKATETTSDAIIYLRQSIKNNDYTKRYERMDRSLTIFAQNMGYKNIETTFYQDLSGFWSYEKVLGYLKADSVKAIYISEITRLSRNIEAYLTIINYAYKNHKKVYLNNTDITSGSGYLSGLIQAIFAEMELLSKQTSFSHYMLEVAQFLNETITFDEMTNKKAKKLVVLAKYADREQFIIKLMDKSIEVLESDKTEELKKIAEMVLDEFNKEK